MCCEGSLGWASSAFPLNDGKSRNTPKQTQVLGKHKLSTTSDSGKPSKSKSRKTNLVFNPVDHPIYDLNLDLRSPPRPIVSFAGHPNLKFDFVSDESCSHERGLVAEEDYGHFWNKDEDLLLGTEGYDMIPHRYDPGLVNDLEDWSSLLQEFTDDNDIG